MQKGKELPQSFPVDGGVVLQVIVAAHPENTKELSELNTKVKQPPWVEVIIPGPPVPV